MGDEQRPTSEGAADTPAEAEKSTRKQKNKVRSAWISFVGRILAQVIGAFATIALGLIVVEQYHTSNFLEGIRPEPRAQSSPAPTIRAKTTFKPSVAVLPLQNFSADATQQYIADGLTDALIARLALADEFRVISRTSTMQYKAQPKNITEIGQELDVDWVIEGSMIKEGPRLRIIAQLIKAESDEHLWARSYDRPAKDLLSVQAELAQTISSDVLKVLESIPTRHVLSLRQ